MTFAHNRDDDDEGHDGYDVGGEEDWKSDENILGRERDGFIPPPEK